MPPDPDCCEERYGLTGAVAWSLAVHAGITLAPDRAGWPVLAHEIGES
jgi:hypothetical protein